MENWKSIKTAPKSGTPILVKRGTLQETVVWSHWLSNWVIGQHVPSEGKLATLLVWEPTHWKPIG
jgi:hypothetical protein